MSEEILLNSETTDKKTTHIRLINELSLKLQSLLDSEDIYQQIVSVVQNKFHYYSFTIWTVSQDGTATLQAQSGAYNKYLHPGFFFKGEGIIGTVIHTKKTYMSNDVATDPHFTKFSLPIDSKSNLSIPVIIDDHVVAVLSIEANTVNSFDDDDCACFESLSHQLSVALTNSKLYHEIKSFNRKLQQMVDARTRELSDANDKILNQQKLLVKENKNLKTIMNREQHSDYQIVCHSQNMLDVLEMTDKIAPTPTSVLLQGESGTGKELIAKRLHTHSNRVNGPYVTINCGALQETLLESELFGHEKGAFTGAVQTKIGLCETADGGTLFLDEIGEMSLTIQAKLLRFLQEGEFYRIGGKKPIHVNVRIISATNRDLENAVKKGIFREDLFYRLNTITLRIPPLRKRREDIRPLIDYFLKNARIGNLIFTKHVDPKVYEILENYDWPGNVRELQNTMERLKILAENNEISVEDIPFNIRMPRTRLDGLGQSHETIIDLSLDELERHHILRTLVYFNQNKTKAAASLGITIKTLYNKLHKYGLLNDKNNESLPAESSTPSEVTIS